MESITLRANAKLNLFLKINSRTDFDYHDMSMINQSISLYDDIKVSKNYDKGIRITDKTTDINHQDNIMYKTAKIINDEIRKVDVDIEITKKIPMQAGLGGGSSDSAAIITALDRLYNLNLSDDKKIEISVRVGADVPFCLFGGSKFVEGIGEKISKIQSDKFFFILIKPDENMPTYKAFELYDKSNKINKEMCFLKEIKNNSRKLDLDFIKEHFYNDFEEVISDKFKFINEIKSDFYKNYASFSMMSGSGTTVYAIFEDKYIREKAYNNLKNKYDNIFLAETVDAGIQII